MGVITYILLCGFPTVYGDNVPQLCEQILAGDYDYPEDYWGDVSAEAIDFIDHLLVVDIKERYTAEQALNHPWLNQEQSSKKLDVGGKMKDFIQKHKHQSQKFSGQMDF